MHTGATQIPDRRERDRSGAPGGLQLRMRGRITTSN